MAPQLQPYTVSIGNDQVQVFLNDNLAFTISGPGFDELGAVGVVVMHALNLWMRYEKFLERQADARMSAEQRLEPEEREDYDQTGG